MEAKIEKFRAMKLPECLIHGDLHYDNVRARAYQRTPEINPKASQSLFT
jgi:Ser/Thr protein kinase RdoA (MazF antagonist)